MEKQKIIDMLNRDIADEHAAIIRYLVHAWLEDEGTPLGSSLLSISREEMWHMHWLGMIISDLGGEPNFTPAPYPFDPTSRSTILKSYIEYEEKLIPHYNKESEMVDDPHIKRVLQREAWESAIHARKFGRKLKKLSSDEAVGLPIGENNLSVELLDRLQEEVTRKYTEMLQHLRISWMFQKETNMGWKVMDQAMEKMKHISRFSEDIAASGRPPVFKAETITLETLIEDALKKAAEDVKTSKEKHMLLKENSELQEHSGLVINLDITVKQEEYQIQELEEDYNLTG